MSQARTLSPANDYSRHSDAQERAAESNRWFLIIDNLIQMPMAVDGVEFDCWVNVSFTRDGERGPIEINSLEIKGDLYVILPGHADLVKLDHDHYKQNHLSNYNRLVNHIELLALTKARLSNDWEMEEV